jgi:transposase InsO family protein
MPWKETCAMDEKMSFIVGRLKGDLTMTELCEQFGISRDTGYELWRRYQAQGPTGLKPLSRAPHRPGQAMACEIAEAIIALRLERPSWGPKKLRAVLQRRSPAIVWPAPSTMGDLLRREGLSKPRRRQRRPVPLTRPFLPVCEPNDRWCIDFKGWFRTTDGQRCDPLTLTDAYSRFLIECRIVPPTTEGVWPLVERAFRELGLPRAIRSDNGVPFACTTSAGGLTRLSVHWVKLGIELERIEPGKPQQNGRHERMHGTLKAETSRPPAASPVEQQARFEHFRQDFNYVRPHEALDQNPPASCYSPSPRPYPARVEDPWYDADHAVRRVRSNGEIKWGGDFIFVSEALIGELVGIAETEQGDWIVRFADIDLGLIDRRTKKLRRFQAGRPARLEAQPEQTGETVRHVAGL